MWEESHGQFSVVHKTWKLVHGRCAKIQRVTTSLSMDFVCLKCRGIMEGTRNFKENGESYGESLVRLKSC